MQVGCEVTGEPAPHVSWATPSRGEIMANHTLLGLQTVTRADAGQLWWIIFQKNSANTNHNTKWRRGRSGHSFNCMDDSKKTKDWGPLFTLYSHRASHQGRCRSSELRKFNRKWCSLYTFISCPWVCHFMLHFLLKVLWCPGRVYFSKVVLPYLYHAPLSVRVSNLWIAPQVSTLALLTMERVSLPRPRSCWMFNVSRKRKNTITRKNIHKCN